MNSSKINSTFKKSFQWLHQILRSYFEKIATEYKFVLQMQPLQDLVISLTEEKNLRFQVLKIWTKIPGPLSILCRAQVRY